VGFSLFYDNLVDHNSKFKKTLNKKNIIDNAIGRFEENIHYYWKSLEINNK